MSGMAWNGNTSTTSAIAVLFDDLWSARRAWYDAEDDSAEEEEACALVDEIEEMVSALPADSPAAVLVKLLLIAENDHTFNDIEWGATGLDYAAAADLPRTSTVQLLGTLLRDLERQVAGTALADVLAKHRLLAHRHREELLKDPDVAAARARIEGGRARDAAPREREPAESREQMQQELTAVMELTMRIVETEKPQGYGPDESRASGDHFEDAMKRADAAIQARRYMAAGRFSEEDRPKVAETLSEFERRFGPIEGAPPPPANAVHPARRPRMQHPSSW